MFQQYAIDRLDSIDEKLKDLPKIKDSVASLKNFKFFVNGVTATCGTIFGLLGAFLWEMFGGK